MPDNPPSSLGELALDCLLDVLAEALVERYLVEVDMAGTKDEDKLARGS